MHQPARIEGNVNPILAMPGFWRHLCYFTYSSLSQAIGGCDFIFGDISQLVHCRRVPKMLWHQKHVTFYCGLTCISQIPKVLFPLAGRWRFARVLRFDKRGKTPLIGAVSFLFLLACSILARWFAYLKRVTFDCGLTYISQIPKGFFPLAGRWLFARVLRFDKRGKTPLIGCC